MSGLSMRLVHKSSIKNTLNWSHVLPAHCFHFEALTFVAGVVLFLGDILGTFRHYGIFRHYGDFAIDDLPHDLAPEPSEQPEKKT